MFFYLRRSSEFRLAFCAIGIFFFHFYFGVLQEKITRGIYAEKGQTPERFQYTMALVFVLCAANVFYATMISALVLKEGRDETNSYDCALTSLIYLAFCSFHFLETSIERVKIFSVVPFKSLDMSLERLRDI